MATSLMFTASDQTIKLQLDSEEITKPETTKSSRGRKPTKTPQQKKQPQRGLGVAQLERLRLQEHLKKISEIPQVQLLQPLNLHPGQFHLQTATTEPLGGVPVHYGPLNYNVTGPVLINGSGGALFGFDRTGNHGFGGDFGGSGMVDPSFYGMQGGLNQRLNLLNGVAYETSKELSSIPNNTPNCLSSSGCDTCCKMKKQLDGDEKIGFNFPKFNTEKIPNFVGETNIIGLGSARASKSCCNKLGCNNFDEGVEVVKIHRKGRGGRGLVMEYEFFPDARAPCKNDRSTYPEDMKILSEEASVYSVLGDDQAPNISYNIGYGADNINTNSVDLSLKLSY